MKKNKKQTIVVFLLQGRPLVVTDDDSYPYRFDGLVEAHDWVDNDAGIGVRSAESVIAIDLSNGETLEIR